jgi:hypothetical protein
LEALEDELQMVELICRCSLQDRWMESGVSLEVRSNYKWYVIFKLFLNDRTEIATINCGLWKSPGIKVLVLLSVSSSIAHIQILTVFFLTQMMCPFDKI